MLETLLDVLAEVLGLGGNEPPPRREATGRTQTPQSPQAASDPVQQLRERLADRVRQGKPVRKAPVREVPKRAPMPASMSAPLAGPEPVPIPVPQAVPAAAAPQSDFIAALRLNPAAAQQAFVYSEIFGKPVADR